MKKIINNRGFSLLELLIVLAIVSILTLIAYPTYSSYVTKVRRSNATVSLLDLAARLEQYYEDHHSYQGATIENLGINNKNNSYDLQIKSENASSYLIAATPIGAQVQADQNCGSLMLDQIGNRAISGRGNVARCWS
jgi:type IV pilus assembly protein PilE